MISLGFQNLVLATKLNERFVILEELTTIRKSGRVRSGKEEARRVDVTSSFLFVNLPTLFTISIFANSADSHVTVLDKLLRWIYSYNEDARRLCQCLQDVFSFKCDT